jgi:hypothetical protein
MHEWMSNQPGGGLFSYLSYLSLLPFGVSGLSISTHLSMAAMAALTVEPAYASLWSSN